MLSAFVAASLIAAARADCAWISKPEFTNLGVVRGGCYMCDVGTDALVETCRARCLDDANCKSFGTAPSGPDFYDNDINCCIEHTDSTDTSAENYWVSAEDAGICESEVSQWTTHEPDDFDISACVRDTSIDTSGCTLVNGYVDYDEDYGDRMRDDCDGDDLSLKEALKIYLILLFTFLLPAAVFVFFICPRLVNKALEAASKWRARRDQKEADAVVRERPPSPDAVVRERAADEAQRQSARDARHAAAVERDREAEVVRGPHWGLGTFREGDRVEARFRGREKYYPGQIRTDRGDGTYDVSYDDGTTEMRVREDLIRKGSGMVVVQGTFVESPAEQTGVLRVPGWTHIRS